MKNSLKGQRRTVRLIIICLGFSLSFILGLTYLRNERKEWKRIKERRDLVTSIKAINLDQRRVYAYACPLRSYLLTGVVTGEFDEDHYPWLLQYNSIDKEQQKVLENVLSEHFGVVDRNTLEIVIEEFLDLYEELSDAYKSSIILFLLSSAADLRYISRAEMMNESEKYLPKKMTVIDYLNEFLLNYGQSVTSEIVERKILREHILHLMKDELSPLRFTGR